MEDQRPAPLHVEVSEEPGTLDVAKVAPPLSTRKQPVLPPPSALRPDNYVNLPHVHAPEFNLAAGGGDEGGRGQHWHLQTRRPMPVDMYHNLEALGGPRQRVPLVYDGDPERSLRRLHDDIVSSYRLLCSSLGEGERHNLTNPAPYAGGSLLALPMADMGYHQRPATYPSSSSSLLTGFPSHGRRALAAPPGGASWGGAQGGYPGGALAELRGYGSNLGGGVGQPLGGYDHYNNAGGSHMSRMMPFGGPGGYNSRPMPGGGLAGAPNFGQQPYIPGYATSLIPALAGPSGYGVRVSSISTYDQGEPGGGMKGESQLLYPPAGVTFEGSPSASHAAAGRQGIDTLSDFHYRKPQPLNVDTLDAGYAAAAQVRFKSERDQLDSFLSDYVEAGIKPNLPPTSALLRPERLRAQY